MQAELGPSDGIQPSPGLLEQVQKISALNVFAMAFPVWVKTHQRTASLIFKGHLDGSVEMDLGLPKGSSSDQADDLFRLLEECQRLSDLQLLVGEFKNAGVSPAVIQRYVIEAETLAHRLFKA